MFSFSSYRVIMPGLGHFSHVNKRRTRYRYAKVASIAKEIQSIKDRMNSSCL